MSLRSPFDPRVTPARPDLAAAHLEGRIAADRFSVGVARTIGSDVADLHRLPRPDAPLETQAIHGEPVTLYDEEEGWGWVQLGIDGYVGYVAMHALTTDVREPTHIVGVNRTFAYPAPDMKQPVLAALPLGARIAIESNAGAFARLAGGRFVIAAHLTPLPLPPEARGESDAFVSFAEGLLHTPYLWGGRTPLGIDCSGLVQLSLAQTAIAAPRDTDMQENIVGIALDSSGGLPSLRRGDLVFWKGHVGIMRDADTLLHANAHHMLVASEPLHQALDRILAATDATFTSIRRITNC